MTRIVSQLKSITRFLWLDSWSPVLGFCSVKSDKLQIVLRQVGKGSNKLKRRFDFSTIFKLQNLDYRRKHFGVWMQILTMPSLVVIFSSKYRIMTSYDKWTLYDYYLLLSRTSPWTMQNKDNSDVERCNIL